MVYIKKRVGQLFLWVSAAALVFALAACQSEADRKEQADFYRIQAALESGVLDDEKAGKWRKRLRQNPNDVETLEAYLKYTVAEFERTAVLLHQMEPESEKGAQVRDNLLNIYIAAVNQINRALREKDSGFQSAEAVKSVIALQKIAREMEKQRVLLEELAQKKRFWPAWFEN